MPIYRKFKSLITDQQAYAFDSEHWDTKGGFVIEPHFRMYDVLGDGLTQHSGDWGVTKEHLADFLYSIVAHLLERPEEMDMDDNLFDRLCSAVLQAPRKDRIAFASSVRFKESDREYGKRRYYSMAELKTAGKAKEYDKRYVQIEDWCDGSPKAIYRMVVREYADGLEKLATAAAIYNWAQEDSQNRPWMETPVSFLGWFENDPDASEKNRQLANAFRMAVNLCESYQRWHGAKCELGNYLRNVVQRKVEQTEAA